jgi:hypothetical protein
VAGADGAGVQQAQTIGGGLRLCAGRQAGTCDRRCR